MATPEKPILFISDLHLGAPDDERSRLREKRFIQWLDEKAVNASELFIVGDLFDFWFEYKRAVPRGHVRTLGKLAELSDAGLPIHMFTGNHDMWIFDYLPREVGLHLYHEPIVRVWNDKSFYIGHGDGLGPGDHGYKFIKRIFRSPISQWLFARLHPNFGIWLADFFSKRSRMHTGGDDAVFLGEEDEWLVQYCRDMLEVQHYDYFIFGHRHLPLDIDLPQNSRYVNLGDWIQYYTYAEFDGTDLKLKWYLNDHDHPLPRHQRVPANRRRS
ncbi:MAG: UDP-2,3-diacylglucosamine diphosphatase [Bacteroidota bacterium]|nr:UDP-2,3-diacylglucosamine diphosphatase [Bacteroidota bacterium]MDX5427430.1 UDP-2,3-diacylglucosamine diphosphatase [Bacteroidota bacterium]MDX5505375.1 UDP-2,3-diacylglucosamine diphosphatase [Bacteroidota bacterium]